MKTVFKPSELPHLWVHRGAPLGRSPSNMSFDGDAFYSYGTVIARRISHKGKTAYVLDRASFSVTTSGAQSCVRQAIPDGEKIFYIRAGKRGQSMRFTPAELRSFYEQAAREKEQEMPSRYAHKRAEQYQDVTNYLKQAREVCEFFDLGHAALDAKLAQREANECAAAATLGAYRQKLLAQQAKKAARELAERTARNIKGAEDYLAGKGNISRTQYLDLARYSRSLELIPDDLRTRFVAAVTANNGQLVSKWQAGESVGLPHDCPTLLRAEGDEMVTTKGARVPLADAKRSYRFVLLAKAKGWHRNGEVHAIGSYQLDAVNEQGVVAGCHRVNWEEIERFAATQGWTK